MGRTSPRAEWSHLEPNSHTMCRTNWTTTFSHTGTSRDRGLSPIIHFAQNALSANFTYLNRLLLLTKLSVKVSDRPIVTVNSLLTCYLESLVICCSFLLLHVYIQSSWEHWKSNDYACHVFHHTPSRKPSKYAGNPCWVKDCHRVQCYLDCCSVQD